MTRRKTNHKYIFIIGGVMSGVGKGIATSSIGTLLQAKGFSVNLMKVDPYLNVDAGTMNPTEHYMTSGMVYRSVIERERALGYGGKFVEAIPHVTDEIRARFLRAAEASGSDISVIEIGG